MQINYEKLDAMYPATFENWLNEFSEQNMKPTKKIDILDTIAVRYYEKLHKKNITGQQKFLQELEKALNKIKPLKEISLTKCYGPHAYCYLLKTRIATEKIIELNLEHETKRKTEGFKTLLNILLNIEEIIWPDLTGELVCV